MNRKLLVAMAIIAVMTIAIPSFAWKVPNTQNFVFSKQNFVFVKQNPIMHKSSLVSPLITTSLIKITQPLPIREVSDIEPSGNLFINYYNSDKATAPIIVNDWYERCEALTVPNHWSGFGSFVIHERIKVVDNSSDFVARIRDYNTKELLIELDLPDDKTGTLHEVTTQPTSISTPLAAHEKILVCFAQKGGTATVTGEVGTDLNPQSESWIRSWNRWTNTTSTYGDLAIWLELR